MANTTKDTTNETPEANAPAYVAWNVAEKGKKAFWTRVGAAWQHKDAKGLTLQLDMLPINGRIVLREPSVEATTKEERA